TLRQAFYQLPPNRLDVKIAGVDPGDRFYIHSNTLLNPVRLMDRNFASTCREMRAPSLVWAQAADEIGSSTTAHTSVAYQVVAASTQRHSVQAIAPKELPGLALPMFASLPPPRSEMPRSKVQRLALQLSRHRVVPAIQPSEQRDDGQQLDDLIIAEVLVQI